MRKWIKVKDILISKGTALVVLGKFNEAIKMFDKAIENNPNNVIAYSEKGDWDFYLIKGITLYGIGEYYEAIKMFDLIVIKVLNMFIKRKCINGVRKG